MRHVLLISVLAMAACEKPVPAKPAQTTQTTQTPPIAPVEPTDEDLGQVTPRTEVREHMREHWGLAMVVRDAVIAATLDELPDVAGELADHKAPDALARHTDAVAKMRGAAERVQKAGDVVKASMATADLAGACGDCHVEAKASPSISIEEVPDGEDATKAHMMRHDWAAKELWAGLVIPSDERWASGAAALDAPPLKKGDFFEDWEITDALINLDKRVHEMREPIAAAALRQDRVKLYGELISNCAACHAATAKGPVE